MVCNRTCSLILFIVINSMICEAQTEKCIAKIDKGTGIGLFKLIENESNVCSYLGIPYAKPPIGKLRFKVS